MEAEEKIIIAFLFKRSGKTELKASDLSLTLSLELGWFTSQQAKDFVTYALQQNFLEKKKNMVIPTFDITSIPIPTGFRPMKQQYELQTIDVTEIEKPSKDVDLLTVIIHKISSKTNQPQEEIRKQIQQIQDEKQIFPEIAALLLARRQNISIDDFFDSVKKTFY